MNILQRIYSWFILDTWNCPRELLGYKCRGKDCDHSLKTFEQAQKALRRK